MQSVSMLLTEARRIAIIVLVIQLLGLGPLALTTTAHGLQGPLPDRDHRGDHPAPALPVLSDVSLASSDRDLGPAEILPTAPHPASVPLAHWLSRAPPVV
jgi:hypothetical protein